MITLRLSDDELLGLDDLARVIRGNSRWNRVKDLYIKTGEAMSRHNQQIQNRRTLGDYIISQNTPESNINRFYNNQF